MEKQISAGFEEPDSWRGEGKILPPMPWGRIGAPFIVALALLCIALVFLRQPTVSAAAANGSYEHDCCGTLVLRNGSMSFGTEKSVSYVVEEDDLGPYVLPETFVGTWEDRGFQVDGSRAPLKLRLDRIPNPTRIELHDVGRSYSFKRKAFRPRSLR